ncbi:MAG: glycosyltransferase [Thermodesulfobacteriota bacterium]|nr:glycosyltransferase [Thermodesulfobacteriota bacterium]
MENHNRQPTISVVIPLYNHENYIDATLDSVISQTVPATEIIVVDDGSTDASWERLQQRAGEDARVIAWSHPNRGAHETLNAAIERATGDYVAILNSDDCYLPGRFDACLKTLVANPTADVVCTALTFIDGRGRPQRNPWYQQALSFYQKTGDLALSLINGNFLMTTSNLFIRRQVFAEVGGFSNLRYAHDLDFFLRLLGHDKTILWLEPPLLAYRMHDTNTIKENPWQVKTEWAAVVAYYLYRYTKGDDWSYLDRLVDVTDRHQLTRLLLLFFIQFQNNGNAIISPESYLADGEFVSFLEGLKQ